VKPRRVGDESVRHEPVCSKHAPIFRDRPTAITQPAAYRHRRVRISCGGRDILKACPASVGDGRDKRSGVPVVEGRYLTEPTLSVGCRSMLRRGRIGSASLAFCIGEGRFLVAPLEMIRGLFNAQRPCGRDRAATNDSGNGVGHTNVGVPVRREQQRRPIHRAVEMCYSGTIARLAMPRRRTAACHHEASRTEPPVRHGSESLVGVFETAPHRP
jgi:hypothetical protein